MYLGTVPRLLQGHIKNVPYLEIEQLDLKALLISCACGRWALMLHDDIERDKSVLRYAVF